MQIYRQFIVFIAVFIAAFLCSADENEPFEMTVEISEGDNAVNWESLIFADKIKKEQADAGEKEPENSVEENATPQTEKKVKNPKNTVCEEKTGQEPDMRISEKPEPENIQAPKEPEYSPSSPKWGHYYGEAPKIIEENQRYQEPLEREREIDKPVAKAPEKEEATEVGEPATFPIDVIISNQSDTEFDSILSTGVRVSYKNIYTTLLIGTNYSASAARPLSLGLSVGGLYRIHDFALKAGFGYRKIWDFGHSDVDDSSLGLEASVSYSIFDWFAISAGTGFNYSVLKNSSFSDGIFVPTFFTALEFNLIR